MYKTASRYQQHRVERPSLYENADAGEEWNEAADSAPSDATLNVIVGTILVAGVLVVVATGWAVSKVAKGAVRTGKWIHRRTFGKSDPDPSPSN